jgi:putative transposase
MVNYIKEMYHISTERSCRLINFGKSSYHYRKKRASDEKLRDKLKEKALIRRRWGYRRLQDLLRREGYMDNHNCK